METRDQKALRQYLQLEYGTSETAWFLEHLAEERAPKDGGTKARLDGPAELAEKSVIAFFKRLLHRVGY